MTSAPISIAPLPHGIRHTWRVPGSKSITNRAYVLAALTKATTLTGALESDDTTHMRECLQQLGVRIDHPRQDLVTVGLGADDGFRVPEKPLFVGNSGTTVRFLAALAVLVPGPVRLEGDAAMSRRPIADLVDGLRQLGVRVDCPTGCPPLTVHGTGGAVSGRRVFMRGDRSSQYLTALMLVAGRFAHDLEIEVEGDLVSRPYIDMTIAMVGQFGGRIEETELGFRIHGRRRHRPPAGSVERPAFDIEPDASSASYAFATALATGSAISVPGLGPDSLQGDYRFSEVLRRMGARVVQVSEPTLGGVIPVTTVIGPGHPSAVDETRSATGGVLTLPALAPAAVDEDMHHISDTVMTLAAIAPLCDGPTTIRNVANIRIKECDRLNATVTELRRLGQHVEHGDDWLRIHPRPLQPATVHCYDDHRIAMSFAILGLARPGVTIADPGCVAKTYPGFWDDLRGLYAAAGTQAPW